MRDTIVSVAETALNHEISLCGCGIKVEALADEQLRNLKIVDNISGYRFHLIQEA